MDRRCFGAADHDRQQPVRPGLLTQHDHRGVGGKLHPDAGNSIAITVGAYPSPTRARSAPGPVRRGITRRGGGSAPIGRGRHAARRRGGERAQRVDRLLAGLRVALAQLRQDQLLEQRGLALGGLTPGRRWRPSTPRCRKPAAAWAMATSPPVYVVGRARCPCRSISPNDSISANCCGGEAGEMTQLAGGEAVVRSVPRHGRGGVVRGRRGRRRHHLGERSAWGHLRLAGRGSVASRPAAEVLRRVSSSSLPRHCGCPEAGGRAGRVLDRPALQPIANDPQRQEVLALLAQDDAQQIDVVVVELAVADWPCARDRSGPGSRGTGSWRS